MKHSPGNDKSKKLKDFRPQVINANRHSQRGRGLLDMSIRRDGYSGEAMVAAADDELFIGSHRMEVSADIFSPDVEPIIVESDGTRPVVVVRTDIPNADDPKAKRLGLSSNRIAQLSLDWDVEVLQSFDLSDLDLVGFGENELADFGVTEKQSADAEPQVSADRFEEVAKKWETEPGQLWACGSHFVYCGDSLDKESAEIVMRGFTPDLTIADPPYGVNIVAANGYVGGGESERGMIPFGGVKTKGLRGSDGASKPFGSKAVRGTVGAAHVVDVGKYPVIIGDENTDTAREAVMLYMDLYPDAVQVWWGANYYSDILPPSMCWLVWNKETTGNFADCELAWTNQEKAARLFTHRWNGMLRDSERERRWHPTQKPAALAEWVYLELALAGGHIFDPFAGAGWSVLGAEKCGRIAHVIEKSHEYVAVILERFSIMFPALEIKRID